MTFKSSNSKVVKVSAAGKLTAKKTGSAKITVTTANGKTAYCKVKVRKAPKFIKLNTKKKTLRAGTVSYTHLMRKLALKDIEESKKYGWTWSDGQLADLVSPMGYGEAQQNLPYDEGTSEGSGIVGTGMTYRLLETMAGLADKLGKTEDAACLLYTSNIMICLGSIMRRSGRGTTGKSEGIMNSPSSLTWMPA